MKQINPRNGKRHGLCGMVKMTLVFLVLALFFATQGLCKDVMGSDTTPDDQAAAEEAEPGTAQTASTEMTADEKNLEALILLLKGKGLISETEAVAFIQRLNQPVSGVDTDQTATTLAEDQDQENLNKKIEDLQKQVNRNLDGLLQRDRLDERRMEELEYKVYEEVTAKQQKSSWAEKIKLYGDLRLRYQKDFMDEGNEYRLSDDGSSVEPTNIDRERYRYRARLGLKSTLIDPREKNVGKVGVEFRLATGNDDDPVSTNDTFGDMFNKDSVVFDRANVKWSWKPIETVWGSKRPQISLIGGRMANPFFYTDLVWDSDVNIEGATLKLISDVDEGNPWRAFLTGGAYPLDEYEFKTDSKWLYGVQLGMEHRPFWGLNYKLAVAYYSYQNVQGDPIYAIPDYDDVDYDWGEPGYIQGGNTLVDLNRVHSTSFDDEIIGLAADFQELNITARIDIDRFVPIHVILWADYVTNIGYDRDEIRERYTKNEVPDYQLDQTDGYQFGITLGYPKVRLAGEWNVSIAYKYLEADAVLDAFTDSDFNTGGTDAEGYILKVEYGLYKNLWLTGRYLSTNEILEENGQFAVDTLQLDLNLVF